MVFLHVVWRVIVLVRLGYSDCVDLGNLDNFLLWLVEWLVYSTWDGSPSTQTTEKAAAQKSWNYEQNTSYDVANNRSCPALGLSATEAVDCAAIGTGTTAAVVNWAIAIVVGWIVCVVGVALGVVWIVIVARTNNNNWIYIVGGVRWCVVNWLCVSVRRRVRVGVGLRRGVGWGWCCLHIDSVFILRKDLGYTEEDKTW